MKKKISLIISIIFIIFMASSLISCELITYIACLPKCQSDYDECVKNVKNEYFQNLITYEKYLIFLDVCSTTHDQCKKNCEASSE